MLDKVGFECGAELNVFAASLKSGNSRSCGCLRRDVAKKQQLKHGCAGNHGGKNRSPEYMVWMSMKNRCDNPMNTDYHNYGGRGIKYDPRWGKFETFLEDIGMRPVGSTLDRINNNGDYTKDNCQWVTQKFQANNTRRNHKLTLRGITHTIAEWGNITGIPTVTLTARVNNYGWSSERALTTPVKPCGEATQIGY